MKPSPTRRARATPIGERVRLLVSPRAEHRVQAAADWLRERDRRQPVLVVGATLEAAADRVREATAELGATFGWTRTTLGRLAAELALPGLARAGRVPASALAVEAVCARVVARLEAAGGLGRFAPVAHTPGLPRALARTLGELRLGCVDAGLSPDLARAAELFEEELAASSLADRAEVLRLAAAAVRSGAAPWAGHPALLLDLPIPCALEADLVRALGERASPMLVTAPAGDARTLGYLAQALGVIPERLAPTGADALSRLQAFLFARGRPPAGELGAEVTLLSAPGESRECVEIARRLVQEAAHTPFDRMAVLLHVPGQYRAHLEEALRRAGVPAWYAKGSRRPDPAGRALLALLACKAEGLSARRFAEYLSLGELPRADAAGAPPPSAALADLLVPPDDELVPLPEPEPAAAEDEGPEPPGPVLGGTLRVSRRWEHLIVDAAVIGGLDRWRRRLDGLGRELALDLSHLDADEPRRASVERRLLELEHLRGFALPLLETLDAIQAEASWGDWLDALALLASRALRQPERVLAVLAELRPMAAVGPVGLDEVRLVLTPRLAELVERGTERRAGHVWVGPVEAARGLSFDVTFVPGLAERILPRKVAEDPILLDADREGLGDLERTEDRVETERNGLRLGVGAASRRVVLSWPRVDVEKGRPRVPSFYALEVVRAAEGVLPGFDELARRGEAAGEARLGWPAPADPADAIDAAEHDLALLHPVLRRQKPGTGTAHYLLGVNVHLARALRARARRWTIARFTSADGLLEPREEARRALEKHRVGARSFSPTALQHLATCPYRFLLHTVHRLAPREEPAAVEHIDPLSRGSLVHDVQFELLTELREAGRLPITPEGLAGALEALEATLTRVEARYRDDLSPAIARVWEDSISSIRADLREWLRRGTEEPEGFVPWRFELSFGLSHRGARDAHSQEEPARLDNGLALRGSIDLVERHPGGAIRVTDYKTGKARVRQGSYVSGGAALQPVLYALAAEKLFPGAEIRSGRLYYCTQKGEYTSIEIPLDAHARRAADEVARVVAASIEEGRLPASPSEGACRWCDYAAVCGPNEELRMARVKDTGSLADLEHLRSLK